MLFEQVPKLIRCDLRLVHSRSAPDKCKSVIVPVLEETLPDSARISKLYTPSPGLSRWNQGPITTGGDQRDLPSHSGMSGGEGDMSREG